MADELVLGVDPRERGARTVQALAAAGARLDFVTLRAVRQFAARLLDRFGAIRALLSADEKALFEIHAIGPQDSPEDRVAGLYLKTRGNLMDAEPA